jgi:hypothetical protein
MIGATTYNAAKGIRADPPSISSDGVLTVLTVSGVEIGTVRKVTSVSCCAAWKLAGTHDGASDKERQDRRAMVLRTLAADMLDKPVDWARIGEFWTSLLETSEIAERLLEEETKNGTRLGAIWFEDVAIRAEELIRTKYASPEEREGGNIDAAFVERLGELMRWIGRMSKGNSLFVTDTGYIGLGGNAISVEDKVYVLHQGRTPFVLRHSDSRFTLISECYVDGLMYGEAEHIGKMPRIEIK